MIVLNICLLLQPLQRLGIALKLVKVSILWNTTVLCSFLIQNDNKMSGFRTALLMFSSLYSIYQIKLAFSFPQDL